MINPQIKKTIIDALMKVVDSAPTMSNRRNNPYSSGLNRPYSYGHLYQSEMIYQSDVSDDNFKIWIDYVNSVLKISAQHINSSLTYSVYNKVEDVALRSHIDNSSKITEICRLLLDYARSILAM